MILQDVDTDNMLCDTFGDYNNEILDELMTAAAVSGAAGAAGGDNDDDVVHITDEQQLGDERQHLQQCDEDDQLSPLSDVSHTASPSNTNAAGVITSAPDTENDAVGTDELLNNYLNTQPSLQTPPITSSRKVGSL